MDTAVVRLQRAARHFREEPLGFGRRVVAWIRAFVALRRCAVGRSVCVYGRLWVSNRGRLAVGDRVTFVGGPIATELVCHAGAELVLGEETTLNYGASLEAHGSVRVGRRCQLATFVRLGDRDRDRTAPIVIGDDVWLAHGVVVEPGVTIGAGSIVAAGSVVTKDVPPRSMAAGNPARAIPLALSAGEG